MKTGPDDKPGINGGILRHQDSMPKTVNTVEVSSIEEFIEKITRNGGSVAMPKMAIPGVGYQAYCLVADSRQAGRLYVRPSSIKATQTFLRACRQGEPYSLILVENSTVFYLAYAVQRNLAG